jgi:uncharacterized protein YcbK (DUF882 family)
VTVLVAHKKPLPFRLTRLGCCSSVAAILISFGCQSLQNATAEGETRTISFHHTHTNEDLTVTYKVNGRYDDSALAKIDNVLRDWREDKTVRMDPHVIDLLWEVHREVGAKEPIWVVCGYRSPSTNSMLRRHSSGVAKASQHMNGKAVDFYIPGVPLDQLRAAGLRSQRGGVGFYPTSGSPFVHLDTGNVRHWPRMPEAQLASVLSKGPLSSQFASDPRGTAFAQGDIRRPAKTPGLLARLFGGGNDADEEADAAKAAPALPVAKPDKAAEKPAAVARANTVPLPRTKPDKPTGYAMASAISIPVPKSEIRSETSAAIVVSDNEASAPPGHELSSVTFRPVRLAQATNVAEPASATTTDLGGLPSSDAQISPQRSAQGAPQVTRKVTDRIAPSRATSATATRRAPAPGSESAATANGTPWPLPGQAQGEPMPNALFYAAQPTPVARAVPTAGSLPRPVAPTAVRGDTTVVAKHSGERVPPDAALSSDEQSAAMPGRKIGGEVRVGDRFNDPWMRAMILSPSAQSFMKTTLFGKPDFRDLGSYLQKPATVLANAFKDDPHPGMTSEKFAGSAVTFVSANTFGSPQTKR